jgi:hypothetical protein
MHYSETFGGCVYARLCDGSCPPGTVSNERTADCALAPLAGGESCAANAEYNDLAKGCVVNELPYDPNGPHYPWFPGFPYPGYPGQPGWWGGNIGWYPYFPYWPGCGRHIPGGGFTPFGYGYGGGHNGYGYGGYADKRPSAQPANPYLDIAAQSMGYSV